MEGLLARHGIPPGMIGDIFPFHLAFGRDLKIIQTGKALSKICPGAEVGARVTDLFSIITPASVPFETGAISGQLFTVFFVEILANKVVLKGQMVRFDEPDGEVLLFLCSPVVRELDSVANMGLTLNDFAIHDASVDFLILLQTKTNTINDVRKMADRLKQEVAVRREAEKQLKLANEDLENRVAERTQQLTRTNENLHNEIAERERVEEELQVTNIQLKSWVKKLEVYNRQISLLNKMGDMLQACRSVKETYSVIIDSAQQLFPTDSGFLSLQDETDKTFRIVATWGVQDGKGSQFLKDDCWALRRARLHIAEAGEVEALCGHMGMDAPQHGYICAPLTVQGELLGTLHLHCDTCNPRKDRDFVDAEARKHLVQTATEHIGLAIANLRLQESLRQQTIRDALTGLYNRRHMEDSLERETLRAQRNHSTVAVIMTDVDHFKKFNDNFGHQAGDALLRDLGAFLKQHVRGEDIACRYGGEEFILILPTACKEIAMARAEKIREGVENDLKVEFNGSYLPQVTLSLGVAVFPESAATAQEAVMAADAALYHSKQHGRNQATFATAEIIAAGVKEKPH